MGQHATVQRWLTPQRVTLDYLHGLGLCPERVGRTWFIGRDAIVRVIVLVHEEDNPTGVLKLPETTLPVAAAPSRK